MLSQGLTNNNILEKQEKEENTTSSSIKVGAINTTITTTTVIPTNNNNNNPFESNNKSGSGSTNTKRVYIIGQLEGHQQTCLDVKAIFENIDQVDNWINEDRKHYFRDLVKEEGYRTVVCLDQVFMVEGQFELKHYYDTSTEIRLVQLNKYYPSGIDDEPFDNILKYIESNPQEKWWTPSQQEFEDYVQKRRQFILNRDLDTKKKLEADEIKQMLDLLEKYAPSVMGDLEIINLRTNN